MRALLAKAPPQVKTLHADVMHRLRWRRSPQARITRAFVRTHGLNVLSGPFAGMRYPPFAVERGELIVAQLLGAYEMELHDAVGDVIARRPEQVVDIGASDGYYAAGFARALPEAVVHAYEMNPFPARVCAALARENGVDGRIVMHGECRVEDLAALPDVPTFVLSDCEGGEAVLMDPARAPVLRHASLIVELHEHMAPGVRDTIRARFEPTHDVRVVESSQRFIGQWPRLAEVPGVTYIDRTVGLAEFRPAPMAWAVMTPKG